MTTELDDINGIGPATVLVLKQHGFSSAKAIANAEIEQLIAVPGFSYLRATATIESARALLIADDNDDEAATDSSNIESTKNDNKTKNKKKKKKLKNKKAKTNKISAIESKKKDKKSDKDKKTKKAKKK